MTTYALIMPTGDVHTDPVEYGEFQKQMLNEGSVVTLRSPLTDQYGDPNDPWVGWVFDWGIPMGLPINRKAWALYGRSPIYGPMLIATDRRDRFPDEFIDTIRKPIEEWVDERVRATMDDIEARLT